VVAAGWPVCDDAVARDESIEIPVQVNGKLRGKAVVAADATEDDITQAALAAVESQLAGKTVVKVIVAKGRLVSVVVK
jgi:leucyl-tRNA synthetase